MRYKTQCYIVWFVDDEKKTYNPGLIIMSPEESLLFILFFLTLNDKQ